jgi:beta-lactamase class A
MRKRILPIILAAGLLAPMGAPSDRTFDAAARKTDVLLPESPIKPLKWAEMEKAVRKKIARFRGDVGVVIRDLESGRALEINPDMLFPAASMIKVPIMAACLRAGEEGRLSLEDRLTLKRADKVRGSGNLWRKRSGSIVRVDQLIDLMITHSDNTAANIIIDRLGFDYINMAFREMGLEKTRLARKMMDLQSRDQGIENYTTAREMADIIERMYRRDCVCSTVSEKCLEVLKGQRVNDRIPRLLPKGLVVAHKTGLERQICHDAGIVYTENGNFLISVFTRTWIGPRTAKSLIANVSSLAYGAYRPEKPRTAGLSMKGQSGR